MLNRLSVTGRMYLVSLNLFLFGPTLWLAVAAAEMIIEISRPRPIRLSTPPTTRGAATAIQNIKTQRAQLTTTDSTGCVIDSINRIIAIMNTSMVIGQSVAREGIASLDLNKLAGVF